MPRTRSENAGSSIVSHCLNVLELVCWSQRPLTVSEIGDRLDVSKSTAHRVLREMVDHNMVTQKPHGPYRPGPKAYSIGTAVLRSLFPSEKIDAVLDEIVEVTNETAFYAMARPEFPGLLVISERHTSHPLRLQSHAGKCLPEKLFGVKLEKPDTNIRKWMPTTDYTTSCDDEGVKCISSIVRDEKGRVEGVLVLMVPEIRLDAKKTKSYTALIGKKAVALGELLD